MKLLLWENTCEWLTQIVLWDGENTYWHDGMRPSSGYTDLKLNKICRVTNGRFTLIGEL